MAATEEEAAPDVVYGLLRLAGMDVALPLSALREVVPCPLELAGIPASAPGLLGAIELRRLVLPVVDLRPVIGRPDDRRPDQVVVVLAHGGQVLGLLADEVRGVTRLPASALVPARAHGERLLFSHTFRHPDTGRAHTVLDAEAVFSRPGVPTVDDVTRESTAVATRGRGGGGVRMLTVVRCGAYRFAIDAAHVHTTLPTPDLRRSVLSGPACPVSSPTPTGRCRWSTRWRCSVSAGCARRRSGPGWCSTWATGTSSWRSPRCSSWPRSPPRTSCRCPATPWPALTWSPA